MSDGSAERPSNDERRQSYCPGCATRVNPFSVSFGARTRVITYRCEQCRREWEVRTPAPTAPLS